jgi:hypothetical protein
MGSNDKHEVSAEDLRRVATLLDLPMDTVVYAYNTLQTDLANCGTTPWGDDENGRKFGEQYEPAKEDLFEALAEAVTGFLTLKTGINKTADDHEKTEQENAS